MTPFSRATGASQSPNPFFAANLFLSHPLFVNDFFLLKNQVPGAVSLPFFFERESDSAPFVAFFFFRVRSSFFFPPFSRAGSFFSGFFPYRECDLSSFYRFPPISASSFLVFLKSRGRRRSPLTYPIFRTLRPC